jgi:PhnB protein
MVNWKPEGYHTLTPYITVNDVGKSIDFYQRAFGAEEISRLSGPGGIGVMHAELKIGDSMLLVGQSKSEEHHEGHEEGHHEGHMRSCLLHIYVEDVDKAFERAKAAGGEVKREPKDTFWGDRMGLIKDPFGHFWSLATQKEELTDEQIRERAEEFYAQKSKR